MPPVIEPRSLYISAPVREAFPANADYGAPVMSNRSRLREAADQEAWQDVIDRKLIEWAIDFSPPDDDIEPPSRHTLQIAALLAQQLKDEGSPPPDTVVRDANGGVVFERAVGDGAIAYHIWDDGTVELLRFRDAQLIDRTEIEVL